MSISFDGLTVPGLRGLVDGNASAGQPSPDDWPRLRAAGVASVINLRPAAETPGWDEDAQVRAAGLAYRCLPVAGAPDLGPDLVRSFDELLDTLPAPVLVHCASGNRVGALYALRAGWLNGAGAEQAIALGRAAGLTTLEPAVRAALDTSRA